MSTIPDLIAHYLATTYPSVLPTFLAAANVAPPNLSAPPNPDLRTLVADYISHSLAEKASTLTLSEPHDILKASLDPAVHLKPIRTISGVSADSLLSVRVANLPRRKFDTETACYRASAPLSIIVTSVDKTVKVLDYAGEVDQVFEFKASILCVAVHPTNPRYLVVGGMDGCTNTIDLISRRTLQTFRSGKPVTRVAFSPDGLWLVTASHDRHITTYTLTINDGGEVLDETDDPNLSCEPTLSCEECSKIKVGSNPEALVVTDKWAVYSLRESSTLHYLDLETKQIKLKSLNLHAMDNHVSFAVLDLAVHSTFLACLTGDRGAERILLYDLDPEKTERLACLWTGVDSDPYFLPRMSWLPDGTGLITTTPTGHLNLVSLSGEVRSSIKLHGAPGSSEIVRDVSAVSIDGTWQVVSVGYDKTIRISGP